MLAGQQWELLQHATMASLLVDTSHVTRRCDFGSKIHVEHMVLLLSRILIYADKFQNDYCSNILN